MKKNNSLPFGFLLIYLPVLLLLPACKMQAQTSTTPETTEKPREFTIAVLPDTQYYTKESNGGSNEIFKAQTDWIIQNREKENIVYVIHLGDIVNDGDKDPAQWARAVEALYPLEKPQPGLPHGIPYGLAVGNHDQDPSQFALSGKTYHFNKYFGIDRFKGRSYYGGHYGNDNDSHYDLFSAGGMDFIVIYIEYDSFDEDQDRMNNWAADLLDQYANRKAIVVSHYILGLNKVPGTNLGSEAEFGKQGKRIYDRLKTKPNLFMMLSGHVGDNGEGYRQDTYAGKTVKTFLSDYQSRPKGGNGLMRLMTFSPEKDLISVRTFSPYLGTFEQDDDSEFVRPWFREVVASRVYDFDNDGKSDPAFFQEGNWLVGDSLALRLGKAGDIPVPGNYFGDGQTVPAVYAPQESVFYVAGGKEVKLGQPGDIPLPHDYTGDGVTDLAVWRPSDASWHIEGREPLKFGNKHCVPIPADYDGDGKVEPAYYRLATNIWSIHGVGNVPFGQEGDIPLTGDYTGDGKADLCVFRPSTGEWLIHHLGETVVLGRQGDIPVPGDYEGIGKLQPAVYNQATQTITTSTGRIISVTSEGAAVVNLPYHIQEMYFGKYSRNARFK